jgi:hypothetical protein
LTIPNSVTTIGTGAFAECPGFNGLTIGNSVTTIGNGAFAECSGLTKDNVTLPSGTFGTYTTIETTNFKGVKTNSTPASIVGSLAFGTLDNTVFGLMGITNTVYANAFYYCTGLTGTLTIPASVTSIESNAFYLCDGFNSIAGNFSSEPTIGGSAFYGWTSSAGYVTNNNSNYSKQSLLSKLKVPGRLPSS